MVYNENRCKASPERIAKLIFKRQNFEMVIMIFILLPCSKKSNCLFELD